MSAKRSMNINEASKACGLSPSVLRIWELRYGWPAPKRKPNGYRAYNQHQVDELKRIADLVKGGTPISSLIIDGLPRWPADIQQKRVPQGLSRTRSLGRPSGGQETKIQGEIVEALEKRHASLVKELLQRAFWQVRPNDEAPTALIPALAGLAEIAAADRPLAEDAEVRLLIQERCLQLLRRFKTSEPTIWVVPATPADLALAALATLMLNQRSTRAQLWTQPGLPGSGYLLAGDHLDVAQARSDRRLVGMVSALGDQGIGSLEGLLAAPMTPTPVAPLSTN